MKKLKYTLIELLISMAIFVVMMGILISTFSMAGDIASSETTKTNILQDASVFYSYLTKDFRGAIASPIEPPDIVSVGGGITQNRDPDDPTLTATELEDYGLSVIVRGEALELQNSGTTEKLNSIEFYGSPLPYGNDMKNILLQSPDYELVLRYHFQKPTQSSPGKIFRDQYIVDTADTEFIIDPLRNTRLIGSGLADPSVAAAANGMSPVDTTPSDGFNDNGAVILEGVEDFNVIFWEDYEGGTQITPGVAITAGVVHELETIPKCITFYVTLVSPNPYASNDIKKRGRRTVSKTIYLN